MEGSHSALPDRVGNAHIKMGASIGKKNEELSLCMLLFPQLPLRSPSDPLMPIKFIHKNINIHNTKSVSLDSS